MPADRYRITRVKDLAVVLKDMEPYIKNPRFLRVGRVFTNFNLRPREALANWLLCVVGNYQNGNSNLTFAEDPTGGDGIILDRQTERFMLTEHVFVPPPTAGTQGGVEDLIVRAVEHKARNGETYARGKHLIVFSEAIGWWYPNRAGRRTHGTHHFASIWVVGLERGEDDGYNYWVTQLLPAPQNSPSWKIRINAEFTSWQVTRIQ